MSGLTRRAFLSGSTATAAGLLIGCRTRRRPPVATEQGGASTEFDAWIHVTPDDRIVVYVDKVEMGQGTLTGFATLVGEELEVDPQRIDVRHAFVDERYPGPMQATGGSTSLAERFLPVRSSAARARVMLERAAADRMGVAVEEVAARDGEIVHVSSGRRLSYGAVAEAAAQLDAPGTVALKTPSEFRFIGHSRPRVDGPDKARGRAVYGIDTQLDGLLTAVVARPPHERDRVTGFDATAARVVPGVRDVFAVPTGVAVVADGYWPARKAAGLVKLEVERGDRTAVRSAALRAEQRRRLREESGKKLRAEGNSGAALERAAQAIDVEYYTGHQAHATMEPMNCTVAPRADRVDVYLGTQAPGVVQDVVAAVLGRSRDEVVVHTALLGGGFGRRFFPDVAAEAAEIAKRANAPVKLVWSREDDMARDYYRPATAHRLRGGLDADGRPIAWEHRMVAPSLIPHMAPNLAGALGPAWMRGFLNGSAEWFAGIVPRLAGPVLAHEGAEHQPYAIENVRVESMLYDPGITVGIWRSVGHSNNGFVVESFVDELADAAGRDPLEFRRSLLADHPRHLACLDLVAEKSGWGAPAPGLHQGLAVHESFDTVVAEVAEVRIAGNDIVVERVVCAAHVGLAVNPDIVRAQVESGVIFGLTATLKGEMTFADGVPEERNFDRYPMLRMREAPRIEVHIVSSDDPPTGVGEPGTPPIPAAVANAVYAATGKRLRTLPLRLDETPA